MVAKELIDARWKMIIGAAITVLVVAGLSVLYSVIRDLATSPGTAGLPEAIKNDLQLSVANFGLYVWGQWFPKNGPMVLGGLAAFLGAGLIAGEVGKGTIFFLLSKPVSRERVLITKYLVSAAILLGVSLLGSLVMLLTAVILGQSVPVDRILLATVLLWLGTLSILGIALLFSTLFDDALRPAGLAILVAIVIGLPGVVGAFLPGWADWSLPRYWASLSGFLGTAFPVKEFVICLVTAIVPVAGALALFRKRAY
jgi:ABC-type transport system involved in multi-copper enzyme maturation permease subunit